MAEFLHMTAGMTNLNLYVGETANKGRGIFTKKAIKKDTILEHVPVIIMNEADRKHIDQTLLHNYIFEWQPEGKNMICMALGLIPLYNHSYRSNCEYAMDYDDNTMYIQTVRDIKAGEELTINYNGTWNDKTKLWFDAAE
jgi:SET domain-containing protein